MLKKQVKLDIEKHMEKTLFNYEELFSQLNNIFKFYDIDSLIKLLYSKDGLPEEIKKFGNILKKFLKRFKNILDCSYGEHLSSVIIAHLTNKELKKTQFQVNLLEDKANLDALTGALNRDSLDRLLKELLLKNINSTHSKSFSLIMIDVDNFKNINDGFGHQAGDHILKDLVTIILKNCRESDHLFRYGGDEFILILPDTQINGAKIVSRKLNAAVNKANLIKVVNKNFEKKVLKSSSDSSRNKKITISIGCTEVYKTDTSLNKIISRVDNALYKAKEKGRNKISYF